jgi:hypothetical protein
LDWVVDLAGDLDVLGTVFGGEVLVDCGGDETVPAPDGDGVLSTGSGVHPQTTTAKISAVTRPRLMTGPLCS